MVRYQSQGPGVSVSPSGTNTMHKIRKNIIARLSHAKVARSIITGLSLLLVATACSLSDLVSTKTPSGVTDPKSVETPAGAIDRYKGAMFRFRTVYGGFNNGSAYILVNGLLSDELSSGQYNTLENGNYTPMSVIDSRNISSYTGDASLRTTQVGIFSGLSATRLTAQDAIYALKSYASNIPTDLRGHAHALQGLSEVLLAELYCSGIPLSTLKDGGGFTYGKGYTTEEVLRHSLAQFDTAFSLYTDSIDFVNFTRVVKGRALLNLGEFAEAALAVKDVPNGFVFQAHYSTLPAAAIGVANFTSFRSGVGSFGVVANVEGTNGLNFVAAQDPRLVTDTMTTPITAYPLTPVVYAQKWRLPDEAASITIADWIEARLIEAEADYRAGNPTWLTKLNALRTTCTAGSPCASPAPAGTGGVAGLAPLTMPGSANASVDLIFRERAFWLFLTGHRTGDLRRMIRQYNRQPDSVFPVGNYPAGPDGMYGFDINLPVPQTEIENNGEYNGCFNRDA